MTKLAMDRMEAEIERLKEDTAKYESLLTKCEADIKSLISKVRSSETRQKLMEIWIEEINVEKNTSDTIWEKRKEWWQNTERREKEEDANPPQQKPTTENPWNKKQKPWQQQRKQQYQNNRNQPQPRPNEGRMPNGRHVPRTPHQHSQQQHNSNAPRRNSPTQNRHTNRPQIQRQQEYNDHEQYYNATNNRMRNSSSHRDNTNTEDELWWDYYGDEDEYGYEDDSNRNPRQNDGDWVYQNRRHQRGGRHFLERAGRSNRR